MRQIILFSIAALVQVVAVVFFVSDSFSALIGFPARPLSWELHELGEISATIALLLGLGITFTLLLRALKHQRRAEDALRAASGAFVQVMQERFDAWGLTPAERDVALFALKGFSIAEIAALRNTSDGTIKAQCNAIYRKAGVAGRAQLMSHFLDDLLSDQGVVQDVTAPAGQGAPPKRAATG